MEESEYEKLLRGYFPDADTDVELGRQLNEAAFGQASGTPRELYTAGLERLIRSGGSLDDISLAARAYSDGLRLGTALDRATPLELVRTAVQRVQRDPAAFGAAMPPTAAVAASPTPTQGGDMGIFSSIGDIIGGAADSLGGFIGGAADVAGDVFGSVSGGLQQAGRVLQDIRNDPIGAQLFELLDLPIPQRMQQQQAVANGSGGGQQMPTSTTTGSPMNADQMAAQGGDVQMAGIGGSLTAGLPAIRAALARLLGGPVGQIGAGVAGGLATDQALQALFSGEPQMLQQFGPPPRNPLTGRRLSSITFLDRQTGKPVVYKSQGTALLTTGDISSTRRVQRVARRAARGRRRASRQTPVLSIQAPRQHAVCGVCLTSPCGCK